MSRPRRRAAALAALASALAAANPALPLVAQTVVPLVPRGGLVAPLGAAGASAPQAPSIASTLPRADLASPAPSWTTPVALSPVVSVAVSPAGPSAVSPTLPAAGPRAWAARFTDPHARLGVADGYPGGPTSLPPGVWFPLETVKAHVALVLGHVAAAPTGWRGRESIARGMRERLAEVRAHRGIPRLVRTGWFSTETRVEPIAPELLAVLPEMEAVLGELAERRWNNELWASPREQFLRDASELLYSFGELTRQARTREKLFADYAWLWGTYRLGRRR